MKICLLDFWNEDPKSIFAKLGRFLNLDPDSHELITDPEASDLIIYSVFGKMNQKYQKKKIFFSGENKKRWGYTYQNDPNTIYYLVTNHHQDYPEIPQEKIQYTPHFVFYLDSLNYYHQYPLSQKKKFCCIVVSNQNEHIGCQYRKLIFDTLSKYKPIDSAGESFNNTGYLAPRDTKEYLAWINQYKFMITFENSMGNGYVTEKVFNAICGGTVPIYWGDNTTAKNIFGDGIVYFDGNNIDQLTTEIISLDQDHKKYDSMNKKNKLTENFYSIINNLKTLSF